MKVGAMRHIKPKGYLQNQPGNALYVETKKIRLITAGDNMPVSLRYGEAMD